MSLIAKTLRRRGRASSANRKGVAALEFALTLSVWLTLLLGVADGSYYLLVNERVDRIAYTVTDIVTQYEVVTLSDLDDLMLGAEQLMRPMAFNPSTLGTADEGGSYPSATGYIIISSIYQDPTYGPLVKWQYTYPPSGNGVSLPTSSVGSGTGSPAVLPSGLTLNNQDNIIITEVYYTFSPLFVGPFLSTVVYRQAVYKPRLSPLVTPPT